MLQSRQKTVNLGKFASEEEYDRGVSYHPYCLIYTVSV